jgi:hypothetical protein
MLGPLARIDQVADGNGQRQESRGNQKQLW